MAELPLVDLPALRLAALPHVDPADERALRRLWVDLTLRIEGGLKSEAPDIVTVGVMDRQRSEVRYSLGVPVTEATTELPDGLASIRVPAGSYMHYGVNGPYAAIPAALEQLSRQIERASRTRTGIDLEIYRPPDESGRPLTDLYIGVV